MNRPPQPADSWWAAHAASCPGRFVRVNEYGEPVMAESGKRRRDTDSGISGGKVRTDNRKITLFFPASTAAAPRIYTCVSCDQFRTPKLDELNSHLDECLSPTAAIIQDNNNNDDDDDDDAGHDQATKKGKVDSDAGVKTFSDEQGRLVIEL